MNSVPPIDSGDPRLTAYVLGELSPVEGHAVEAWLLKSPEARAEVQGIREMVSLIRGGFAAELETSLAAPVQETPAFTVVRAAETSSKIVPLTETQIQRRRYVAAGLAVAATITLAAIAPNWMAPKSGGGSLAGIDLPPFSGPVPGLSSVEEGVDGIYLASAGGVLPEFRSKSLGNDPIITEVRVLSEDPAVLRNFPLTPEMTTYLPAPRGAAVTPTAGGRAMYLDNERYPNLEIAQPAAGWDDQQIASGLVSPIVP
ncbi:MAG: hypothetical protein KDM63_11155, partial [Verrucomicrobiae bacterium]|nr:hypothetical protein [Verrucomicrobiae bacterium]